MAAEVADEGMSAAEGRTGATRPAVKSLTLVLTTRCPLACPYCSQGGAMPGMDMPPAVLDKALRLAAEGDAPLTVQLTGGEPALVPELVERAIATAETIPRPLTIALQTSGVGLDRAMLDFLKTHRAQVGVSLDGPPPVQEAIRGQAAATLRGLALLEEAGLPFRVTTVLSAASVASLDRLVFFLAHFRMARGIGLDILVKRGRAARADGDARALPPDAAALEQGLVAMSAALDMVNRNRRIPLRVRELDRARDCLARPPGPPRPFCLAATGESLAVAPDGRLYPCAQVLGDGRFAAGTADAPQAPPPFPATVPALDSAECDGCPFSGRCPGDCPGRLTDNPPEARGLACALYRTLARHLPHDGKDTGAPP